MEINESDDNDEEKDEESEDEEPDKQMGDVEDDHPTNEVGGLSYSLFQIIFLFF